MSAIFENAFNKTIKAEGGYAYSNRVNDRGGETYAGISRKQNPLWPGWTIVDSAKLASDWPRSLDRSIVILEPMVKTFYMESYWQPFATLQNQRLAEVLFDTAVNCGIGQTARFVQRIANLLDGRPDNGLAVDGGFGPATLSALTRIDNSDHEIQALIFGIKVLRAMLCFELAESQPNQESNIHGWIYRIDSL